MEEGKIGGATRGQRRHSPNIFLCPTPVFLLVPIFPPNFLIMFSPQYFRPPLFLITIALWYWNFLTISWKEFNFLEKFAPLKDPLTKKKTKKKKKTKRTEKFLTFKNQLSAPQFVFSLWPSIALPPPPKVWRRHWQSLFLPRPPAPYGVQCGGDERIFIRTDLLSW